MVLHHNDIPRTVQGIMMSEVHLRFIEVHHTLIKVLNLICFIKQGAVLDILIMYLMIRNIRVNNVLG